jgi:hypothetical protein
LGGRRTMVGGTKISRAPQGKLLACIAPRWIGTAKPDRARCNTSPKLSKSRCLWSGQGRPDRGGGRLRSPPGAVWNVSKVHAREVPHTAGPAPRIREPSEEGRPAHAKRVRRGPSSKRCGDSPTARPRQRPRVGPRPLVQRVVAVDLVPESPSLTGPLWVTRNVLELWPETNIHILVSGKMLTKHGFVKSFGGDTL